jgi:hypothetical protein
MWTMMKEGKRRLHTMLVPEGSRETTFPEGRPIFLFRGANVESAPARSAIRNYYCPTAFRAGREAPIGYGSIVLRDSKEKRSMEPRQLRLPGFTRLWAAAMAPPVDR